MMKNKVFYSLLVLIIIPCTILANVVKRNNNNPSTDILDYSDYAKYDEFPVVPKRAALLFDQLMIALQKVVDNQGRGDIGSSKSLIRSAPSGSVQMPNSQIIPSTDEQTMDLQRRGQAKSRVYWRCYFNAVTCFKRK